MLFWSSLNMGLWYIWSSCLFSSSFSADTSNKIMELQRQNLKTTSSFSLGQFHISEDCGFLLPKPLVSIEPLIRSECIDWHAGLYVCVIDLCSYSERYNTNTTLLTWGKMLQIMQSIIPNKRKEIAPVEESPNGML